MHTAKTLIPSGIGIRLNATEFRALTVTEAEQLLAQYQFMVVPGLGWSPAELQAYLEQFGPLVRNQQRDQDTMLTLDGSKVKSEVVRGNGRLPLHRDGLLMNEEVKYVAILCLQFEGVRNGRTYISDNGAAWHAFPQEIKNALTENGIEVLPQDVTYYLKNEAQWYPFPGTLIHRGKTYMNGGLPYHKGERASFIVRIARIGDALSEAYFQTLEQILESPAFTYYHEWSPGDLILFDNRTVLHGREAYEGHRSLVQMQVKEAAV
ncbi:MAG: TauD/TfdA family dioxygenase [Chitinophagales bacterium]|nr:TauD/TfdA family dioxygenase [Chitinophagales bacterium]